jgi:hypothetical protein
VELVGQRVAPQFLEDVAAGDHGPRRRVLEQARANVHAGTDEHDPASHGRAHHSHHHLPDGDAHAGGDPGSVPARDVAPTVGEASSDRQGRPHRVLRRREVQERAVSLEVLDGARVGRRDLGHEGHEALDDAEHDLGGVMDEQAGGPPDVGEERRHTEAHWRGRGH